MNAPPIWVQTTIREIAEIREKILFLEYESKASLSISGEEIKLISEKIHLMKSYCATLESLVSKAGEKRI